MLIICVERLLHIGSHFSLRKWRRRPHFPIKLAAVASFSYKIGGGGLIFLQNWRRRQGFGNITGRLAAVLTCSGYWQWIVLLLLIQKDLASPRAISRISRELSFNRILQKK